jgi:hypothetical protein
MKIQKFDIFSSLHSAGIMPRLSKLPPAKNSRAEENSIA